MALKSSRETGCGWLHDAEDNLALEILGDLHRRYHDASLQSPLRARDLRTCNPQAESRPFTERTGREKIYTELETDQTLRRPLRVLMIKPLRLLITPRSVQLIAVYMAYLFGHFYLIVYKFPPVWKDVYCESIGLAVSNEFC